MIPRVLQSVLLDEWYITTKYKEDKNGIIITDIKYPLDERTIKAIAYDFLFKGLKEFEEGYRFEVDNRTDKKRIKVTVEVLPYDE